MYYNTVKGKLQVQAFYLKNLKLYSVFCNGTYAAKFRKYLPLADSWGHQTAPNSFCAWAVSRITLGSWRFPGPPVRWERMFPPHISIVNAFGVSVSKPRFVRLQLIFRSHMPGISPALRWARFLVAQNALFLRLAIRLSNAFCFFLFWFFVSFIFSVWRRAVNYASI